MKSKRILLTIFAGLIVLGGVPFLHSTPANAASDVLICNDKNSLGNASLAGPQGDEYIYRVDGSAAQTRIYAGQCVRFANTSTLRIKFSYYDSYRVKSSGGKYGKCHKASDSTKANPGSSSKYTYKGYQKSNCKNNTESD